MSDDHTGTDDPLSARQLDIIGVIYRLLTATSSWPTWSQVDQEVDFSFDIANPWAIVSEIDRRYLWAISETEPQDTTTVGLSIRGLAAWPAAAEDLGIFLDAVAWVAQQTRSRAGDISFTPQDLSQNLQLPAAGRDQLLARHSAFWQANGSLTNSIGGVGTSDWQISASRRQVRVLRDLSRTEIERVLNDRHDDRVAIGGPSAPGKLLSTEPDVTLALPMHAASAARPGSPEVDAVGPTQPFEEILAESGTTYRVFPQEELGHGGQGRVYLGHDPDGQEVAIKRISLRGFDTTRWYRDARTSERERVVAEYLRAAGAEGVLMLLDQALGTDELVYVYPRAQQSLDQYLSTNIHRSPAATVRCALELANGLLELHVRGVLHRDIKPPNALHHDGRWKWTDLGTARLMSELTSTYTLQGVITAAYAAPEVTRGEDASERSDVYSFGCVMYALATGQPPFTGVDVVGQHRSKQADLGPLKAFGESYADVVRHSLSKDPRGRPDALWVAERLSNMERRARGVSSLNDSVRDEADSAEPAARGAQGELRQRLIEMRERSEERSAVLVEKEQAVATRHAAADAARRVFERFFDEVRAVFDDAVPHVQALFEQDTWILSTAGRRLRFSVAEPADLRCSALLIGSVWVETRDEGVKSLVANIVAIEDSGGQITWKLLRLLRNDQAAPDDRKSARVGEALSDGRGGAAGEVVEKYYRQAAEGRVGGRIVTVDAESVLSPYEVTALFLAEVEAIEAAE
ncbi:protein kinase domain-containing protein [Kribbella sp. CA-253562]|uniref:protein kinase domain-containing protein n=1 Tax=Kribbella sp. CA-253562 TaxID=3239942 RepID=UPI003D8E8AA8